MQDEDLLKPSTFRDTVSTVTKDGKRKWIYAVMPKGSFYKWRTILAILYLTVFFTLPLIQYHGKPYFMVNVVDGEFILFGNIFWPQDFIVFAIGMLAMIVFVILFTVIYGRIFCGWVCPQTIFMEFVFRKIEWWIEGSPQQQMNLDKGPWTTKKIYKKVLKHTIYVILSLLFILTFLAYIISAKKVFYLLTHPTVEDIPLFLGILLFAGLFYVVYAYVRDIVCTTICPYGRLQGVLTDLDTMQVSYDYNRGEPRGFLKKNEVGADKGDCIDCKKCVHVCPTGIDIRNGVQLDCVGCTACIDACDEVMVKINRPKGLIRYASENEIKKKIKYVYTNRAKAYTAILVLLLGIMTYLVISSKNIEMMISKVSGSTFQQHDGVITNMYNGKLFNKTVKDLNLEVKVENFSGAKITLVGHHSNVAKRESISDLVFLTDIPENEVKSRSSDIQFGIYIDGKKIQTIESKFLGPFNY